MAELFPQKQFDKLHTSITWSNKQLTFQRDQRVAGIRELVGKHYMSGGNSKIMPVNTLKLAYDIYVRHLAARNPRGMFSTKYPEFRPTAKNFELAVNQIPDEIHLGKTLRQVVGEALFFMGVVKCGLSTTGSVLGQPYGESFVDLITGDDYFCDLAARSWETIQYEGNDYWMEFEDFEDWIDAKDRKDIKKDEYESRGIDGSERAESVTSSDTADTFRDKIWLRDVWLPKEKLLLTYAVTSKKVVSSVDWESDAPNPYLRLGYSHVPGNLLPLPPVAVWRDLNELSNALFRKLGDSADSYKKCLGFTGGNDAGVTAFKTARHGEGFNTGGSQKPDEWTAGGVDAKSLAFYLQVKELYSYFAGNLDSLGGLAPMSATIGQDRLLAEAAGAQVRDMADQTIDFVRDIFKALAYYEWNNPVKTRRLKKPIPGTGTEVDVEWGPNAKQGRFDNFDIDIDVYSMQDESPSLQMQKLMAYVQSFVLPFAPMIQQAGGTIDVEGILKEAKKLSNLKLESDIVTFPDDPLPQRQNSTQQYVGAPKSPEGGGPQGVPQQGGSDDLMQQLMGME